MKSFYEKLNDRSRKRIALLVDPDCYDDEGLNDLIGYINMNPPDLLLVGGSLLFKPIEITSEMDFKIWGVVTFAIHKI